MSDTSHEDILQLCKVFLREGVSTEFDKSIDKLKELLNDLIDESSKMEEVEVEFLQRLLSAVSKKAKNPAREISVTL